MNEFVEARALMRDFDEADLPEDVALQFVRAAARYVDSQVYLCNGPDTVQPLSESKVAIVTTAGVHHKDHFAFDMNDKDGDPSFRIVNSSLPTGTLTITHDYYDHADADRDINIVFPIDRLKELESVGYIGKVSNMHLSFMGHITGPHVKTLVEKTAPDAAEMFRLEGVDVVLLAPG